MHRLTMTGQEIAKPLAVLFELDQYRQVSEQNKVCQHKVSFIF